MYRTERLVGVLRLLLGAAFVALLVAQVLVLPEVFSGWAEDSAEGATLRWPLLTVSVLELLCVQVVILCTWRLLTMVEDDRIFSTAALLWVNTIIGSIAAAWLLLLGAFGYVGAHSGLTAGLSIALLLMLVAGAVLGLLMAVMRALLRQATSLRADMEAVI